MPEAPTGDVRPPSIDADERTTLTAYLDYLREAVIRKLDGVTDAQAHAPGVRSGTSLAWLVRHLTAVEDNWFVWAYAGRDVPLQDDRSAPGDAVADLLSAYRAAVARANAVVAACADLDRPGARSRRETAPPTMRWVLVHMIEETARHAGHADILREQIDGATGR